MDIAPPAGVTVSPNAWAILVDNQKRPGDPDVWWEMIATGRLNKLWHAHRDYILAEWVVRRPGTRPNCWWVKDMHGAERQQLSGKKWHGMGYWCGAPLEPKDPHLCERATFESQPAYLLRNNLLFSGELERLAPMDFTPVSILFPPESAFQG
jgi:hypothetical protein